MGGVVWSRLLRALRDVPWELLLPCQDWQSGFGCSRETQARGQLLPSRAAWLELTCSRGESTEQASHGVLKAQYHCRRCEIGSQLPVHRSQFTVLAGEQREQSLSGVLHTPWWVQTVLALKFRCQLTDTVSQ